jgi:hypothetical protein
MTDSNDTKKISRKLAEKYAGDNLVPKAPEPVPEQRHSIWDDAPVERSYDRPRYVRDRWASKPPLTSVPTRRGSQPLEPVDWAWPDPNHKREPLPDVPLGRAMTARPPYVEGDVDWDLAETIVIDRRVTWTHFVHMMGLEYPLYPQHDVEIYGPLNKIFLTRKHKLYTE